MNREIARLQYEIKVYKEALKLQRKASGLTPMERVIQRIATKRLIIAVEQASFQSSAMMSQYLFIAGVVGVDPKKAFQDRKVGQLFSKFANSLNFIPHLKKIIGGNRRLTDSMKEDLLSEIGFEKKKKKVEKGADPMQKPPAWVAGKHLHDKYSTLTPLKILSDNSIVGEGFKFFQKSLENYIIDIVRSKGFQDSAEVSGRDQEQMNSLLEGQQLGDHVDDDLMDDTLDFVGTILGGKKRLAQEIREIARPFIAKAFSPNFNHSVHSWMKGFGYTKIYGPTGIVMYPGRVFPNYDSTAEVVQYLSSLPKAEFNKVCRVLNGKFRFAVDGTDLFIEVPLSEKGIGTALGGNHGDFIMTIGNSPVLKAYGTNIGRKTGVLIKGGGKYAPKIKGRGAKIIPTINFVSVKAGGTAVSKVMKTFAQDLQKLYVGNKKLRKELWAKMLTQDVFRRSLQGSQKRLPNQIRAPF